MPKFKNSHEGGRGFYVAAKNANGDNEAKHFFAAAGETFDIDADLLAKACKDPTTSGMFDEGGPFVEVQPPKAKKAEKAEKPEPEKLPAK
jgi:hypothetical protein